MVSCEISIQNFPFNISTIIITSDQTFYSFFSNRFAMWKNISQEIFRISSNFIENFRYSFQARPANKIIESLESINQ